MNPAAKYSTNLKGKGFAALRAQEQVEASTLVSYLGEGENTSKLQRQV